MLLMQTKLSWRLMKGQLEVAPLELRAVLYRNKQQIFSPQTRIFFLKIPLPQWELLKKEESFMDLIVTKAILKLEILEMQTKMQKLGHILKNTKLKGKG